MHCDKAAVCRGRTNPCPVSASADRRLYGDLLTRPRYRSSHTPGLRKCSPWLTFASPWAEIRPPLRGFRAGAYSRRTVEGIPRARRFTSLSSNYVVNGRCTVFDGDRPCAFIYFSFSCFRFRFSFAVSWAFFCFSPFAFIFTPLVTHTYVSVIENECSSQLRQIGLTFSALGPFGPCPSVYDTRCPSCSSS